MARRYQEASRLAPQITIYIDFWDMVSYDSPFRTDTTSWATRHLSQIAMIHAATQSKIVSMGLSVVNLALGGFVKLHSKKSFVLQCQEARAPTQSGHVHRASHQRGRGETERRRRSAVLISSGTRRRIVTSRSLQHIARGMLARTWKSRGAQAWPPGRTCDERSRRVCRDRPRAYAAERNVGVLLGSDHREWHVESSPS